MSTATSPSTVSSHAVPPRWPIRTRRHRGRRPPVPRPRRSGTCCSTSPRATHPSAIRISFVAELVAREVRVSRRASRLDVEGAPAAHQRRALTHRLLHPRYALPRCLRPSRGTVPQRARTLAARCQGWTTAAVRWSSSSCARRAREPAAPDVAEGASTRSSASGSPGPPRAGAAPDRVRGRSPSGRFAGRVEAPDGREVSALRAGRCGPAGRSAEADLLLCRTQPISRYPESQAVLGVPMNLDDWRSRSTTSTTESSNSSTNAPRPSPDRNPTKAGCALLCPEREAEIVPAPDRDRRGRSVRGARRHLARDPLGVRASNPH